MMKFKKFLAAAMTSTMMFGVVATAAPAISIYADDIKVVSVKISGADVIAAGSSAHYSAKVDLEKKGEEPEIKWSVEGAKSEDTKFNNNELTVGGDETAEKLTVKATCGTVTDSFEVIVGTGASLSIDYSSMTATISTNGDDSFLALEVLKDSEGAKAGTVYWYEGDAVEVDLSFLKLSKEGWVRVFGDKNSTALKIYTLPAQEIKPTVKYVAGKDTFADSFTLRNASLDTLQWKTLYGEYWREFSELEEELDNLTVTGTTLLVRSVDKDWEAPASTEVKVKIAACPKAPKVTVDYANNAIKFAKGCEIRVPDWTIPAEKEGELVWEPFYYTIGSDKADLTVAPDALAEKLVSKYITEYNTAQGKLSEDNKGDVKVMTTESKKNDDGEVTEASDKDNMLADMAEGYSILVRTAKDKKAASQPTFVDVKAAPEIQIRQKTETVGSEEKKVDENVIVVMGVDANGDPAYTTNTLTYTYSDTDLKLTPVTTNGVTYSYSLDGGNKFTKLTKETSIKLTKIDATKGVIVRTQGTKEDAKNGVVGNWASNTILLPVAVGEIKIAGKAELTASASNDVVEAYTATVKDAFGNELKDMKLTWSATGTVTDKVEFDAETQKLTVKSDAEDVKVTITVTCGEKTESYEVTIKAAPAA